MKEGDTFLLGLGLKIDKEVAAYDQIKARKGRVGEDVMLRKYHEPPYLFADYRRKPVLGICEIFPHESRGYFRADARRIFSLSRLFERALVDISRKDLDLPPPAGEFELIMEHHGYGISLFAGSAGRWPYTDGRIVVYSRQLPYNPGLKGLPCKGVPEEGSDTNHEVEDKIVELRTVIRNKFHILIDRSDPAQVHAPRDPAGHDALFVKVEVVSGLVVEQPVKGLELVWGDNVGRTGCDRSNTVQLQYFPGDLLWLEHAVRLSCGNRSKRHWGKFGSVRVLDKDSPAHCPDFLYAPCAVGPGPGKDYAYYPLAGLLCERQEEFINREV